MKLNKLKLLVSLIMAWFRYCPLKSQPQEIIWVEWKNNHSNVLACDGKFSSSCGNSTKEMDQT